MRTAFVRCDLKEDPQVLGNLKQNLALQNIVLQTTPLSYKEIAHSEPFIYYRNPYLRYWITNGSKNLETQILDHHANHLGTSYITTYEGEVCSYDPTNKAGYSFNLAQVKATCYEPEIEPLPVLLGTHNRPLYLRLTLNSLLYSLKSIRQKIYVIVSDPCEETLEVVKDILNKDPRISAVRCDKNLKYAFANFGTKFYGIDKFLHHEDDGILPENFFYHVPFWTSQLNHRSKDGNLVVTRIFEGNWTSDFHRSKFVMCSTRMRIPDDLWHYFTPEPRLIIPMGGMGMVIDSKKSYRDFKAPGFHTSDHNLYHDSNQMCMLNVPIYHIGANYQMDYPTYKTGTSPQVERIQVGVDMRSGEEKVVDLAVNYSSSA